MLRLRFMRVFTSPATGLNLLGPNCSRRRRRKVCKQTLPLRCLSELARLDCPQRHSLEPARECTVGLLCLTRDLCLGAIFSGQKNPARTWPSAPRFGTAAEITGG